MVSVALNSRTTIPTIRGVDTTCPHSESTSTATSSWTQASGGGYVQETLPDGETAFFSCYFYGSTNSQYYYFAVRNSTDSHASAMVGDDGATLSTSKYNAGALSFNNYWKNTTGSPVILSLWGYSSSTGQHRMYWNRFMRMNDSDLAKWEEVNLPTTRYRKYAVDKYYLLAKWTVGSFNIDGYAVNTQSGGIVEVPVETIVSSTALTGSGAHFFQVTGQGFTVTA
jgi:hypothetical protein